MNHRATLLAFWAVLLCAGQYAQADNDRDGTGYYLPVPDANVARAPLDRPLPVQPEVGLTPPHTVGSVCGIDVSHYQGQINWQMTCIDENVRYVYIKATEGSGLVDCNYRKNIREARRNGLLVGSYHFFSPSVSSMMQLRNFTDAVRPYEQDLIPIVDVERRGRCSLGEFHRKLEGLLRGIERVYGVRPIIYTGVNFFNKYLAGRFSRYDFMIARYGEDVPELMEDVRILLWQFTQEGRVAGVSGCVDRSCFLDKYGLQDIMIPRK